MTNIFQYCILLQCAMCNWDSESSNYCMYLRVIEDSSGVCVCVCTAAGVCVYSCGSVHFCFVSLNVPTTLLRKVVLPMMSVSLMCRCHNCAPPLAPVPLPVQTAMPMDVRKQCDLIYLDGPLTADAILKCIHQRFLEQKNVVRADVGQSWAKVYASIVCIAWILATTWAYLGINGSMCVIVMRLLWLKEVVPPPWYTVKTSGTSMSD